MLRNPIRIANNDNFVFIAIVITITVSKDFITFSVVFSIINDFRYYPVFEKSNTKNLYVNICRFLG